MLRVRIRSFNREWLHIAQADGGGNRSYDWYARWSDCGVDALADRSPLPRSVWNRIPEKVRKDVVDFALSMKI